MVVAEKKEKPTTYTQILKYLYIHLCMFICVNIFVRMIGAEKTKPILCIFVIIIHQIPLLISYVVGCKWCLAFLVAYSGG
jgi:hypothetical protein